MKKNDVSPRIVFRYKRELITFFNKSVFKFVLGMWSALIIFTVSSFMIDREKFFKEWPLSLVAFAIMAIFTFYIYRKTKSFSNYVKNFRDNGTKTSGKILDVVAQNGDVKNPKLLVEYIDPKTGKTENFLSDAVTGDPALLLSSRDVDVYVLGEEKFATNFKLAYEKQRPYGKRR
ncbi:hypothetical protein [Peptoniphilus sp.]|jgi:hypothetical protein|uniref:hypothetical protein n=1 Tax=Peptoniphilus sp. TaxID=1971214 RepID=UPI003D940057